MCQGRYATLSADTDASYQICSTLCDLTALERRDRSARVAVGRLWRSWSCGPDDRCGSAGVAGGLYCTCKHPGMIGQWSTRSTNPATKASAAALTLYIWHTGLRHNTGLWHWQLAVVGRTFQVREVTSSTGLQVAQFPFGVHTGSLVCSFHPHLSAAVERTFSQMTSLETKSRLLAAGSRT
jgi:hypothetical protein